MGDTVTAGMAIRARSALMSSMSPYVWLTVLVWNAVVFFVYGWDKRMARVAQPHERRRIRESTLLWLLFLCGPIGAWSGMRTFRHKTRKASFRWRAIGLTLVNPIWLVAWADLQGFAGR